jgi:hypothetical protein
MRICLLLSTPPGGAGVSLTKKIPGTVIEKPVGLTGNRAKSEKIVIRITKGSCFDNSGHLMSIILLTEPQAYGYYKFKEPVKIISLK